MTKTRKEIAVDFLTLCAFGNPKNAFDLYVGNNFKHHNPYFKGDKQSLMVAMEESTKTNPNKIFEIKQIIEGEDFIALHSFIKQQENNLEIAVVHILKFSNDKIIELWDIIQPFPENIINEYGMF